MSSPRGHWCAVVSRTALTLLGSLLPLLGCQSPIEPTPPVGSPLRTPLLAAAAALAVAPPPPTVGAVVWTKAPLLEPRFDHAMATLANKVVLFGGQLAGPLDDTWEWDGAAWTLKSPSTRPPARYSHAMATVGDKIVTPRPTFAPSALR